MKPFLLAALLASAAFFAGGCGGSESSGAEKADRTTGAETEDPSGPADWTELEQAAGALSKRLLIPTGPPPKKVVIRNLKRGSGPTVEPGDTIRANYVSFHYHRREVLEDYWQTPPSKLIWGVEDLVEGWEPGLKGMRVGGVRELIVPSAMAYEYGPLVYLVKLVKLEAE